MAEPTPSRTGWRQRLGRRSQVVAAALIVACLVLAGGVIVQAQLYSPDGTVRAFFAALESGNAGRAAALIDVGSPTSTTDSVVLGSAAFAAALRSEKQVFPSLRIGPGTSPQSDLAIVPVTYSGKRFSIDLKRQTGFYLDSYTAPWRLLSAPVQLTLTAPAGTSRTTVDGQAIKGGPTAVTAALLPLRHVLAFSGGPLVQTQIAEVDLTAGQSTTAPVLAPKLSPLGIQKATEAIAAALNKCAAATGRAPADCPQSGLPGVDSIQPAWQLVGVPTTGLAFSADDKRRLVGTGHYQMVMTSGSNPATANHQTVGGAYSAVLAIGSSDIQVQTINPGTGGTPAPRPAGASDDAARQLVAAAFMRCAASTVIAPPDCPQADLNQSVGGRLENVQWHLSGDPTANAQVTFDGDQSILRVSGTFAMSVDYDFVDIGRIHHADRSTNTHFEADLFWDGTALKLVTVAGNY